MNNTICNKCGTLQQVPPHYIGQEVKCTQCGVTFTAANAANGSFPQHPPQQQSLGDNAGVRLLLPVGRSGWAIAAGYLGLFGLIVIPAPLALIVSIIAILDIQNSKTTTKPKHGMGRAIFGLIVGVVGSLILAFFALR